MGAGKNSGLMGIKECQDKEGVYYFCQKTPDLFMNLQGVSALVTSMF